MQMISMTKEDPPSWRRAFIEKLLQLEKCTNVDDRREKIKEMSNILEEIDEVKCCSLLSTDLFNELDNMIDKKKISLGNAIWLLKRIGYCKVLKDMHFSNFEKSLLRERFEKMINDENEKKEEKNEKHLADLCECYIFLHCYHPSELLSTCVPCLLKAASNKERNEETQKEVEIALLALSNAGYYKMVKILYLNEFKEIKEIMQYHQVHHNLTQLAYQSAWRFFINQLYYDENLEDVIVNELYFVREARREVYELTRCVDWKRKGGEKAESEVKEVLIIRRWLSAIEQCLSLCSLRNEEYLMLIINIVLVFRAAKYNYGEICKECICSLANATENEAIEVEVMLKSGAFDAVLEEIQSPTLNNRKACESLIFFKNVSRRMKWKKKDGIDETKRKETKIETYEKMEEEGYEDFIACFHEIFHFFNDIFTKKLSLNICEYFIYV